jgi:hypothetical protein
MVGEGTVHGHILKLTIRVLVERAHPDVTDALSGQTPDDPRRSPELRHPWWRQ